MKQLPSYYFYKKCHKANYSYVKLLDRKNFFHLFGQYGLQSINYGKLTFKQIEACRRTIKRGLKKLGFLFIKVFTGIAVTKKSTATRMGKRKRIYRPLNCYYKKRSNYFWDRRYKWIASFVYF